MESAPEGTIENDASVDIADGCGYGGVGRRLQRFQYHDRDADEFVDHFVFVAVGRECGRRGVHADGGRQQLREQFGGGVEWQSPRDDVSEFDGTSGADYDHGCGNGPDREYRGVYGGNGDLKSG